MQSCVGRKLKFGGKQSCFGVLRLKEFYFNTYICVFSFRFEKIGRKKEGKKKEKEKKSGILRKLKRLVLGSEQLIKDF